MPCEYCNRDLDHDCRCPRYEPNPPIHYCSICGEGILDGEEYIVNDDNRYVHYECCNVRDIVEFLGYKIEMCE